MKIKLDNVGKLSTMPKYSININSFCLICEKIPKSLTSFLKSPSLYLMSCSNLYNQTRKCLYSLSPLSHNSSPFRFLQSASVATTHPTSLAKIINDHILKAVDSAGRSYFSSLCIFPWRSHLPWSPYIPPSCCTSYLPTGSVSASLTALPPLPPAFLFTPDHSYTYQLYAFYKSSL